MSKKLQTQSGRSMIEMLGVLAVIGVLTVGGFSLISKVTTAHKSNVTIDEIGTLANKARMIFHEYVYDKQKFSNTPDMNTYLYNAKAYPESLELVDSGNSQKAFVSASDVKFNVQYFQYNNVDYFYIDISQLDDEMCMAIAQSTWGSPSINGYVGICVGASCSSESTPGGIVGVCTGSSCGSEGNVGGISSTSNRAKNGAKLSLDGAASACTAGNENHIFLTFR